MVQRGGLLIEFEAFQAYGGQRLFVDARAAGAFSRGNWVCRPRHIFYSTPCGHAFGRVLRHNECMVKSVEGVYRNGKVELLEPLAEAEGSRVIVTWVRSPRLVDLRERGIDESQAAHLRSRLIAFAEDWDRPEMAAYDDLPWR